MMKAMALPFPNIDPNVFPPTPVFQLGGLGLGPFAIRWYALGYIAGIVLGWRYATGLLRNARLWSSRGPATTALQFDDLVLWVTFGIILGGRLGYICFYMLPLAESRAALAADPMELFAVWHGGMSFHGGLIGSILATVLYARSQKLPILELGDLCLAAAPFGIFLVRLANFINGELWGRVTQAPWGMVFCGKFLVKLSGGGCVAGYLPRHPSQLYEAALEGLLMFVILRWTTHRAGWLKKPGAVSGMFLLCYGIFRISLENFRMPDAGFRDLPLGLTMGMLLSAPMVLGGVWLVWRTHRSIGLHEPA